MLNEFRIIARTWNIVRGPGTAEQDCSRAELEKLIRLEETALIVIDPWANHPNEGWFSRATQIVPNLVRLIDAFRAYRRPVFYDSTSLPIHDSILTGMGPHDIVIPWDQMGGGTEVLNRLLIEKGVRTLFWAGFATNLCLMAKPCGFRHIMPKDWDRLHFLVRDATIAFEARDTLMEERLQDAACYEVEYHPNGYSCTVEAVVTAFDRAAETSSCASATD